ncbi:MAG: DUF2807 domain-containing protein [bacterium]|nr:DUF2807 domain-containing protein [bacterium]
MKKSNKILISIIIIVFLINLGFTLFVCFFPVRGNGKYTQETRQLNHFDKLVVSGAFSVKVVEGKTYSIKIKADSNIIKYITSTVKNNSLRIYYDKSISPRKKIDIIVTTETLNSVRLESPSYVFLDNIDLKNLNITAMLEDSTGTPTLNATGSVEHLNLSCSSYSKMDFKGLKCKTANIKMYGNCIVKTNAKSVKAYIDGDCKLIYFGNSKIVNPQVVNGGKVIKYGSSKYDFEKPKRTLWVSYHHFLNTLYHLF